MAHMCVCWGGGGGGGAQIQNNVFKRSTEVVCSAFCKCKFTRCTNKLSMLSLIREVGGLRGMTATSRGYACISRHFF